MMIILGAWEGREGYMERSHVEIDVDVRSRLEHTGADRYFVGIEFEFS